MPTLLYEFKATGAESVVRGFKSIEQASRQSHERAQRVARSAATGAPAAAQAATAGISERAAAQTAAKLQIMAAKQAAAEALRGAKAQEKGTRDLQRVQLQAVKSTEREQKAATKRAEKTARDEHRATTKANAALDRDAARDRKALERAAHREGALASRAALRETRLAERAAMGRARERWGTTRTFGRSLGGALRGAGGLAIGAAGVGGGMLVSAGIAEEARSEKASAILANQAEGTSGETRSGGKIKADVMALASRNVARGMGKDDTLAMLDAMQGKSGRLGLGEALTPLMTDIAVSSGSKASDVGETAGQVTRALSDANPNISSEDLTRQVSDIMLAFAQQAKVGAVAFADMASQAGKITTAAGGAKGDPVRLIRDMGVFMQASGSHNAETAATSVKSFTESSVTNASEMEKAGIKVFVPGSNRQQRRSTRDVLMDTLEKTKGDQVKIGRFFKGPALDMFKPFIQAFAGGANGKTDKASVAAGMAAARAKFDSVDAAPMSAKEVESQSARVTSTSAMQLEMALGNLKDAVGKQLLPEVTKLIPVLTGMVEPVTSVTSAIVTVANGLGPLGTLGTVIATKVAYDMAAAGIGNAVKSAIMGQVAASGLGPALGASGAGSVIGGLGAVGLALAGAALVFGAYELAQNKKGDAELAAKLDAEDAAAPHDETKGAKRKREHDAAQKMELSKLPFSERRFMRTSEYVPQVDDNELANNPDLAPQVFDPAELAATLSDVGASESTTERTAARGQRHAVIRAKALADAEAMGQSVDDGSSVSTSRPGLSEGATAKGQQDFLASLAKMAIAADGVATKLGKVGDLDRTGNKTGSSPVP
jgi:hypothetical protein